MRRLTTGGRIAALLGAMLTLAVAAGLSARTLPPAETSATKLAHAMAALTAHDAGSALLQLEVLAREGDAGAALQLAEMLRDGVAAERDPETAQRWLERAAKAGLPEAARRLGEWALHPESGAPDLEAGKMWLTRAALAGDGTARRELGHLLLGAGGDRPGDRVVGYAWLCLGQMAAAQDDSCDPLRAGLGPHDLAEARAYADWIAENLGRHALLAGGSLAGGKVSVTTSPGSLSARSRRAP